MKESQSESKRLLAERAVALFNEFRNAYAGEWRRQEHNERMYRGDHWYETTSLPQPRKNLTPNTDTSPR